MSQDHGYHEVVNRADPHADGHCHEEQAVEEAVALRFLAAGAQYQGVAGREGRHNQGTVP